jgi:hypothetical protein
MKLNGTRLAGSRLGEAEEINLPEAQLARVGNEHVLNGEVVGDDDLLGGSVHQAHGERQRGALVGLDLARHQRCLGRRRVVLPIFN